MFALPSCARRWRAFVGTSAALAALAFTGCGDDAVDTQVGDPNITLNEAFTRADPASESPSGHTVVADCSATGETWPAAAAAVEVEQYDATTTIRISLTGARPDTLFTAWLRLRGKDPVSGETYGGSPLTDAGSTPLAPSTDLAGLAAMSETVGAEAAPNAFWSDASGNGQLEVTLDTPLIGGEYRFDRYDTALDAVRITGAPDAAFMIRLASHCTDGLAHGLVQQDRETWFNWSPQ